MDAQPRLLQPTALLDFTHPAIEAVVQERGWRQLPTFERIGAVYDFVRNEIAFGYNAGDELPASAVMADGIGSPAIAEYPHGFLRVDVMVFHKPARLISPNRNVREVNAAKIPLHLF